jgi:tRNA-binding EMAP/Myf-like protein
MNTELYVVGLVVTVNELSDKLKHCIIDVGGASHINVVTNAPNVAKRTEGKKVIVAPVGVSVGDDKVEKRNVGGVLSEGMLLDCPGMGWTGGAAGNAVLVPDSHASGSKPPLHRPRGDVPEGPGQGAAAELSTASSAGADKKAAKEAAKAAAAAKREAKKAEKASKKGAGGDEVGAEAGADE